MSQSATFHLRAPDGGRWTARAGSALVGRAVRYGKLGKVGEVVQATPVNVGRSLRLRVALSRTLVHPDPRKFTLAPEGKS